MVAKKKVSAAQQKKNEEKAHIAKVKRKAPRQLFAVVSGGMFGDPVGDIVGTYAKKRDADKDRDNDEVVMGPYVLSERERN